MRQSHVRRIFFGATSTIGSVLDSVADQRKNFVPFLDPTAADVLEGVAHKARRAGIRFDISGANALARHMLSIHGVKPLLVHYTATIQQALTKLEGHIDKGITAKRELAT